MFTDDRDAYRRLFFQAWEKHKKGLAMEPIESQLIEIIIAHPEYHALLDNPKQYTTQNFSIEENPFFHMSLHLSLREQVSTNRPAGIKDVYQIIVAKYQSHHDAEHAMTTVLAQTMFEAQQNGRMPDEQEYLRKLKAL